METYVCDKCQLVTPLINTGALHRDGRRWCTECERERLNKVPEGHGLCPVNPASSWPAPVTWEKEVVVPFIDRLIMAGVIPEPAKYRVESGGLTVSGGTGITVSSGGTAPVVDRYNEGWNAALEAVRKSNEAKGGLAVTVSHRTLTAMCR